MKLLSTDPQAFEMFFGPDSWEHQQLRTANCSSTYDYAFFWEDSKLLAPFHELDPSRSILVKNNFIYETVGQDIQAML